MNIGESQAPTGGAPGVFSRKATGLVREASLRDVLAFNVNMQNVAIGVIFSLLLIPPLYPAANIYLSTLIAFVIAGLYWANVSRISRSVVLSLREKEFIEAAKALGASNTRIIFRHLIPNALGSIIVYATVLVAISILLETALSFLGFGVTPPDTSLGLLVSNNQTAVDTRPWLFYFPGLFIILIALTINFIGDGLRDAFDPQQNKVRA